MEFCYPKLVQGLYLEVSGACAVDNCPDHSGSGRGFCSPESEQEYGPFSGLGLGYPYHFSSSRHIHSRSDCGVDPCCIGQKGAAEGRDEHRGVQMGREVKNLLIMGRPGVGKTTLIKAVVGRSTREKTAGFFTQEVREDGKRTGFKIETLDGRAGVLATILAEHGPRVGRYRVNLRDLERIGVTGIEEGLAGCDLIVIDEIGKMELLSKRFRDVVKKAFDSDARVLATVKIGRQGFIKELIERGDTEVLTLTEANREAVAETALNFLEGRK